MTAKLKERRAARRQFDNARDKAQKEYQATNLNRAVVEEPYYGDWERGIWRVVVYTGEKVALFGAHRGYPVPHGRVYSVNFKTQEAAQSCADAMNANGLPDFDSNLDPMAGPVWYEVPNFKLWLPVGHAFHRSQRP